MFLYFRNILKNTLLSFVIIAFQYNIAYTQPNNSISNKPEVNFKVYHHSNDTSTLYFHLSTKSLLYVKPDSSHLFQARYSIKVMLFSTINSKEPVNSIDFHYIDTLQNQKKLFINDSILIPITTEITNIKLVFTDNNRNSTSIEHIDINKKSQTSSQFFHVTTLEGTTICSTTITQADIYKLTHFNKNIKRFYVSYIKNDFSSVAPPYIENPEENIKITVDSSFILTTTLNGHAYLNLKKTGIYHICIDTNNTEGIILSQYHEDFPNVTSPIQLIYPLKYITTKSEYKKLSESTNLKSSLDAFWVEKARSFDKARKAIQEFYSRVIFANTYFTSYKEGWKTDRGSIYIVYGPPTTTYKDEEKEVWTYGEIGNLNSIKFVFIKKVNPYTTNHFQLERSNIYRNSWILSTENWH